jgi:hypothetical protein
MKLYCISAREKESGEHSGYTFVSSYDEMREFIRSFPHLSCGVSVIQVEQTKSGLIAALNLYAGHPDNAQ